MTVKRIVADTNTICDINIMPASSRNRFVPLWNDRRQDFLLKNGIVHCGLGENRAGYEFGRVDPDFHLALFTSAGSGVFRDGDGNRFTARRGDLAVLPAHAPHAYAVGADKWNHFWFHLRAGEQWSMPRGSKPSVRRSVHMEELEHLLICYYTEAIRDSGESSGPLWHIGESILHYLRKELATGEQGATSDADLRLKAVSGEMRESPNKAWTLKEISDRLCFSRIHAIRFFKARMGRTPFEYLAQCRMQSAAQLLLLSSDKIRTIAGRVGYSDPFAFSVAFSRYHKISPRAFRVQHGQAGRVAAVQR